jgi:hypothetical protein
MQDLTLVTTSFNTPQVIFTLLTSFAKYHIHEGDFKQRLLLYENSTNDLTQKVLDHHEVPYIKQPNGRHHFSIERALQECTTRYALVVDSDIIFRRSIEPIFEMFKANGSAALGHVVASRYDYNLFPRVQPWFMFLDLQQIRAKDIHYTDWDKIKATGSEGFFKVPPIPPPSDRFLYDVGATFYADMVNKDLKVYSWLGDPKYYTHLEGMSWRSLVKDKTAVDATKVTNAYWAEYSKNLMKLSIKGIYEA